MSFHTVSSMFGQKRGNLNGKGRLLIYVLAGVIIFGLLMLFISRNINYGAAGSSAPPQVECGEAWSCTSWQGCHGGLATRICKDSNSCGTTINKPSESVGCGQTPYCFDGMLNQDESGVDCGGNKCTARCADNARCYYNSDCAAGICMLNVCNPSAAPAPLSTETSRLLNFPDLKSISEVIGISLFPFVILLAIVLLIAFAVSNRRSIQQGITIGVKSMNLSIAPTMPTFHFGHENKKFNQQINYYIRSKRHGRLAPMAGPAPAKPSLKEKVNSAGKSLAIELSYMKPFKKLSPAEKSLKKYLNTGKHYKFNTLTTKGYGLLNKVANRIEVKREEKAITSNKTMFKSAAPLSERKGLPFEREVGSFLRRHNSSKLAPLVEPTRVTESFVSKLKRLKLKTRRETAALLKPLQSRSKFDHELGGYLRKADPSSMELKVVGKSPESHQHSENFHFGVGQKLNTSSSSSILRKPQSKYNHRFLGIEEAKKQKEEQKLHPMKLMEFASKIENAIGIHKLSMPASIKPSKHSVHHEKNIIGAKYEEKKEKKKSKAAAAAPELLEIPSQRTDGERQIFEEEKPVNKKGLLKEKPFKKLNRAPAVKHWMVSELKEAYKD